VLFVNFFFAVVNDSEWVKKCMDFMVEGVRPRGDQREYGRKWWRGM